VEEDRMTKKSHHTTCKKVRHKTHDDACIALKRVQNVNLNVYQCPKCNFWHLGSSKNPMRFCQRIDQVIAMDKAREEKYRQRRGMLAQGVAA
jgi:hypothetical protein